MSPYTSNLSNPNATGTLYYTVDGTDSRAIGGGIAGTALTGSSVTLIAPATTVIARIDVSATNEWSPLTEASYLLSAAPATTANLLLSKLHYNPSTTVANAEYLELLNISSGTVNLSSCSFTVGITFAFPANYVLTRGQSCVIVQSSTGFAAAFPGYTGLIAGQYAGSLDNGGERLLFVSTATGSAVTIKDFTYDDVAPWPLPTDGTGPALVLIRPETNPAHGTASNWHPSSTNGSGLLQSSTTIVTDTYMTLSCTRSIGRDDVAFEIEAGTNLTNWNAATLVSRTPNYTTGTETCVYRDPNAMTANAQQFIGAKATRLP